MNNEVTPVNKNDTQDEVPPVLKWMMRKAPPLRFPLYYLFRLGMRWGHDQCPVKAAAMAFFGLLSIFPIVLAAVSILATVLAGNTAALENFQNFVEQFFPGESGQNVSEAMENAANKIAVGTNVTALSVVALGSLIWSGRAYFATLAEVLNSVWPRTARRSFWQSQLVLWSTFIGAGMLWFLSTLSSFLITFLSRAVEALPDIFQSVLPWVEIGSRVSSWLLTVLMFWLIYRFLPNVQTGRRRRMIIAAALLAAFGWEGAKYGFTIFLSNLDRYQAMYGSVTGVVVTLMWIYVSSLIILLGAEAVAAYEETFRDLPKMRDA